MPRYAAVDIGSNSVRMEVAELLPGVLPAEQTCILASERQVTRLGESVFRTGLVSREALDMLCGVLARMAGVYRSFGVDGVRAVATAALRDTRNQTEFLVRTSAALGVEVEIISGEEEARLIHLGVLKRWPNPEGRFLIIDIGGGSAEIIVSQRERLERVWSLPLGALRLQSLFLRTDPPSASELFDLSDHIEEQLGADLKSTGPVDLVIGTSATAAAIVSAANGIPRSRREDSDRLSASALQIREFYRKLRTLDVAARRQITGVGPQRAEIIIPGTAVLLGVIEKLGAPALFYSVAGVRDGIIAELAANYGAPAF